LLAIALLVLIGRLVDADGPATAVTAPTVEGTTSKQVPQPAALPGQGQPGSLGGGDDRAARTGRRPAGAPSVAHRSASADPTVVHPPCTHRESRDQDQREPRADEDRQRLAGPDHQTGGGELGQISPLGREQDPEAGKSLLPPA
jgi:hypothetical protein